MTIRQFLLLIESVSNNKLTGMVPVRLLKLTIINDILKDPVIWTRTFLSGRRRNVNTHSSVSENFENKNPNLL
jgi:hypothetical protein